MPLLLHSTNPGVVLHSYRCLSLVRGIPGLSVRFRRPWKADATATPLVTCSVGSPGPTSIRRPQWGDATPALRVADWSSSPFHSSGLPCPERPVLPFGLPFSPALRPEGLRIRGKALRIEGNEVEGSRGVARIGHWDMRVCAL